MERDIRSTGIAGTMILAFDGSPSSLAALNWARTNAPLLNLEINLVNIWGYIESAIDIAGVGFGSAGLITAEDPKAWSEQLLSNALSQLSDSNPEGVKVTSIEGGVVKVLVELSKGAELLVMGSRGHGKLADLILGSVSESCAVKSQCPVVLVHAPASAL